MHLKIRTEMEHGEAQMSEPLNEGVRACHRNAENS